MTPVWRQKGGIRGDKAKVPPPLRVTGLIGARQRPTLPPGYPDSTIGAGGLNFRVRNGNGCLPSAMVTERNGLYPVRTRGLLIPRFRVRLPARAPSCRFRGLLSVKPRRYFDSASTDTRADLPASRTATSATTRP